MKRIATICFIIITTILSIRAQVPNFAGTVGNGKLYGYTSLKFRPGVNAQETYTTFQYGITQYCAAGLDLYTSNGSSHLGFLIRGGYQFCKWFNIGAQVTPSFNMNESFHFSYLTGAVYLNGNISPDGNFFWCSNTWLTINEGQKNSYMNWEYFGLKIPIRDHQNLTPMIGAIHSWQFDLDVDLALGAYYTLHNWNLYLWSNDLLKKNPRIVVGVDFSF